MCVCVCRSCKWKNKMKINFRSENKTRNVAIVVSWLLCFLAVAGFVCFEFNYQASNAANGPLNALWHNGLRFRSNCFRRIHWISHSPWITSAASERIHAFPLRKLWLICVWVFFFGQIPFVSECVALRCVCSSSYFNWHGSQVTIAYQMTHKICDESVSNLEFQWAEESEQTKVGLRI